MGREDSRRRVKSLLRKASAQNLEGGSIRISLPEERALLLALDGFQGALTMAFEKRAPHFVAEHVFGVAQAFATFYSAAPILSEAHESIRSSRLQLAIASLRQLEIALQLLGIEIPEQM